MLAASGPPFEKNWTTPWCDTVQVPSVQFQCCNQTLIYTEHSTFVLKHHKQGERKTHLDHLCLLLLLSKQNECRWPTLFKYSISPLLSQIPNQAA